MQLWMSSHFDYDWPEKLFNPTNKDFAAANRLFKNMPEDLTPYLEDLESKRSEIIKRKEKRFTTKEVTVRKFKKLYRNPKQFFKDAYYNKFKWI